MKSLKFALVMIVAVVFILPSCKKGKDDPFISFRSRDGRLMKTWKLTNIAGTYQGDAVTYDGSNLSVAGTVTYKNATVQMTFDKEAAFSYTETKTINLSTQSTTISDKGNWAWASASKSRDNIVIPVANFFGNSSSLGIYYIDELKASTLVLKYDDETVTSVTNLTYTFEKQ